MTLKSIYQEIRNCIHVGDAGILFLIAGLGLGLSGILGCITNNTQIITTGISDYWHYNYIIMGILLWFTVGMKYPPLLSLVIGGWLTVSSCWVTFGRLLLIGDHIDIAAGIVYIFVGLLLVQRSARY